ncbi:hypothetical protein M9458_054628, partial [Cirrhinus mrigala]
MHSVSNPSTRRPDAVSSNQNLVFPRVLKQRIHLGDLPHLQTNSPGKTVSGPRGFIPPATDRSASHNTPTPGPFDSAMIQFARHPHRYRGVLVTSVRGENAAVLHAEVAILLAKDAIETVPSAEMKKGFYSPYFIVPTKGGGLRPILDLRVLNRALHKLPFKMLTLKHILICVRAQDWEVGIRILNYLDDWLILAHSQDIVCTHRDVVLNHLARLGLRVNWEKSKLSPVQSISFLGVELDLVSMTARLSQDRAQALKLRTAAPLKHFQRLLGHMASSAAVTPLGLMYMRPLKYWLHTLIPRWAWWLGMYRVNVTPLCRKNFSHFEDISFL